MLFLISTLKIQKPNLITPCGIHAIIASGFYFKSLPSDKINISWINKSGQLLKGFIYQKDYKKYIADKLCPQIKNAPSLSQKINDEINQFFNTMIKSRNHERCIKAYRDGLNSLKMFFLCKIDQELDTPISLKKKPEYINKQK